MAFVKGSSYLNQKTAKKNVESQNRQQTHYMTVVIKY